VKRAVFFDVGDTLVERPTVGPGRRLAEALGRPPEDATRLTRLLFTERFADPAALAERLAAELGLAAPPTETVAALWAAQETEPVEVSGARDLVTAVRMTGAHVAIVSNIWVAYAAGFRRACPEIAAAVDSWHLSFEAGVAKPAPVLFEAALAAAGVEPAAAIMVGDNAEKDVVPARALGMHAVWVRGRQGPDVAPPAGALVASDLRMARALVIAALWSEPPPGPRLTAPLGS